MSKSGIPFDESLWQASGGPELISDLQQKVTQARLLHADILDIVAEMEQRGIAQVAGYSRLGPLLSDAVRMSPLQARKLVDQAAQVAETVTPTGHTTPAPLPNVRAALLEGLIDGEHITAIADTMKQIPATVDAATRELVESTLAATARTNHPRVVREHGDILLQRLDQDGTEPDDAKLAEPRNSFTCRLDHTGRAKFTGELEPEAAAELQVLLDKWGKPQPLGENIPDPRSTRERLGDAFAEIVHRAANPDGSAKAQLTVFLDYSLLTDAVGTATLETGCPLAPAAVRRLACDAEIIPMVLNGESVPLDLGRARRLVNTQQRAALIARDRGCTYPGCCNPARWADAHHVKPWKDGGATDLNNLVLVCRRHHRVLHHSAWQIRMTKGFPEFIPPTWIDPLQRPMRNTIHHRRP